MNLHLRRTYLMNATVGILTADAEVFATLEDTPGFVENHCVPEGLYQLVPHDGAHFVGTWALVNEALGIAHQPKPGMRSACVIHAGNTTEDTRGCLLVGEMLTLRPNVRINASRQAVDALLALLGHPRDQSHTLLIEGA